MTWSLIESVVDVKRRDDSDDDVHVYPLAGRAHETSMQCWCSPVRDEDVPAVVVHREEN